MEYRGNPSEKTSAAKMELFAISTEDGSVHLVIEGKIQPEEIEDLEAVAALAIRGLKKARENSRT